MAGHRRVHTAPLRGGPLRHPSRWSVRFRASRRSWLRNGAHTDFFAAGVLLYGTYQAASFSTVLGIAVGWLAVNVAGAGVAKLARSRRRGPQTSRLLSPRLLRPFYITTLLAQAASAAWVAQLASSQTSGLLSPNSLSALAIWFVALIYYVHHFIYQFGVWTTTDFPAWNKQHLWKSDFKRFIGSRH